MQQFEQLEHGRFYHIYNHGVGGRNVFGNPDNYEYFLGLYDKYISSVADTYAWVLMPNHFHFLIKTNLLHLTGFPNLSGVIKIKPLHQHFSNLFNAYSKAFNKYHQTRGALFERPFRRKLIDNDEFLKRVVVYIHNNPVHHGFCSHPLEYPWSSYLTCTSDKNTKLKRDEVIGWFGSKREYGQWHQRKIDMLMMDRGLGVD